MLKRIKNAIEAGDTAGLDSYAHKMKGSLKYLAAEKSFRAGIRSRDNGQKQQP
ncbi:MAG: Hpt domain-containing protein [Deltaproteobacteria bacterium]|nr:Hpt domain-containing protein [Deltaproteobacteria bacterium]MBW2218461.1 Hpt domain-containing protein [Deltaproteobacteria bacterium]